MKNIKNISTLLLTGVLVLTLAGCGSQKSGDTAATAPPTTEPATTEQAAAEDDETTAKTDTEAATQAAGGETTILVAAAASLKYSYEDELIPMFEAANPGIKVEGTFDSSGKLQTQIEEGMEADVFMSAAMKQMNALKDENMIDADSIVELLENKIVLITGKDSAAGIATFEDIVKGGTVAIGDPESVPAGQYAKEALTTLGLWDQVEAKASLGTNVTEVLNWVAEGSADAGIVYATDAATNEHVVVAAEAPEGSLSQKVIYPVGVVTASAKKEAAQKFVDFLQSDEAVAVFEKYGFTSN